MKNLLFACAVLLVSTASFASVGEYNSANSCVMTWGKEAGAPQKLIMVCDGKLILNVIVAPYSTQYAKDLEITFKSMVNSDGMKKCQTEDQPNVWFVLCSK